MSQVIFKSQIQETFDLEGAVSLYIVSGHWPANFNRQLLLIHRIKLGLSAV